MISGAGRGKRLTGQRRQVHLQVTVDDPSVGADPIALGDHQHITGHQGAGLDLDLLTVPHDAGMGGQIGGQRLHRAFRLKFLNERKAGVQHDHRNDCRRKVRGARQPGQHGRDHQHQGQRVGDLLEQFTWPPSARTPQQLVGPIHEQPPLRLPAGQPQLRSSQVAKQQIQGLPRIGRSVRCGGLAYLGFSWRRVGQRASSPPEPCARCSYRCSLPNPSPPLVKQY